MTKLNEAVNTTIQSNAGEKPRKSQAAESLFNVATLGAVVACAIIGPKLPPLQGD